MCRGRGDSSPQSLVPSQAGSFSSILQKSDGKGFHPNSWSPLTRSTSHPSFFGCWVVCTHSLIALSGGRRLGFKRYLGTICFRKACMFVIFRTSVLDLFGCSPKESHADLAFSLSAPTLSSLLPCVANPCCTSCRFVHLRLFSVLGPRVIFYKHTVTLHCLGT